MNAYTRDVDATLGNEFIQLKNFENIYTTRVFTYHVIKEENLQVTFVDSEINLRLYLSMMVTNYTSERFFSNMKLIKSRL